MSKFGNCEETTTNPKIVLRDKRSRSQNHIQFNNPNKQAVRQVQIDGCVIQEGARCDFLVICQEVEHFIELKGKDISHAVEQLQRTIEVVSSNAKRQEKYCFVITSRSPLSSPQIQELRLKFKRNYKASLVVKNGRYEHHLE